VPLAEQDRSLWNTRLIAEGVDVLQAALARDRLGEFQAQAAIAALHADARTAEETDWVQIVEWYDELVRLTDSPVARLNRAVAVGEADGPRAGLAALAGLDPALPRHAAVAAYLHERDGDPVTAARLYAEAARSAPNLPERDHLTRQAARLNAAAARLSGGRQASADPVGRRARGPQPARPPAHRREPAVARGANVKAVQRMLGHASAAMTLDVYSGLFDDDLAPLAERRDAELDARTASRSVGTRPRRQDRRSARAAELRIFRGAGGARTHDPGIMSLPGRVSTTIGHGCLRPSMQVKASP
jgi:hypothetical protein